MAQEKQTPEEREAELARREAALAAREAQLAQEQAELAAQKVDFDTYEVPPFCYLTNRRIPSHFAVVCGCE